MSLQPYQAIRSGAGVRSRPTRGAIALGGADRADYLQGLLTNEIVALGSGEGCYAAYLTPQGRLVTDMEVLNLGDRIVLDLDRSIVSFLVARLEEFVFTEDVTVTDLTDTRVGYGVDGPLALTTVASTLGALGAEPELVSELRDLDGHRCRTVAVGGEPVVVARTDELGVPGVVLLVAPGQEMGLHGALLTAGAVDVDPETAEVVRIESGRPRFPTDMDDETIPLEAGIEDRAISMTKGCYVGQEVIVRILHRGEGRVARRLVGLTLDPDGGDTPLTAPDQGASLWHEDRVVGRITSAAVSLALQRVVALGYVPREMAEPGSRVLVDVDGDRRGAVVTPTPFVTPGVVDHR